jgi:uncharacterized protein (TIGR02246 family)
MQIARLLIAAVAVGLSFVSPIPKGKVNLDGEAGAIRKRTSDWFAAESRRDLEASLSFLAEDAVIQPEGGPTITGRAAMRALYEEFFKEAFTELVMKPRTIVVAASGDLAYDIGPWSMVTEGPQGRTEVPGKSTIIWRKVAGEWKAALMSFSMDASPSTSSK